jgi:hypothetical protein
MRVSRFERATIVLVALAVWGAGCDSESASHGADAAGLEAADNGGDGAGHAQSSGSADEGSADAGSADAGSADAGSADEGSADAGSADVGSADEGSADAGSADEGEELAAEDVGDESAEVDPLDLPPFSFFVMSLEAIIDLSGNPNGFGGDLRFGEEGPGAGLRGADKLCAAVAERSMEGSAAKQWRAFLSATADERGLQVDAIDRVGEGPWYDRLGRLVAAKNEDLVAERPVGIDPAIANDLPNEYGVPNHQPDPTKPKVDNHDILTGSNALGRLFSATATCQDWTTSEGITANGKPRVGHSWPTAFLGGGGGGGKPPGGGPSGGDGSMSHWISALNEAGCGAGINLIEQGGPPANATTVGAGGGYGAIYCFALNP